MSDDKWLSPEKVSQAVIGIDDVEEARALLLTAAYTDAMKRAGYIPGMDDTELPTDQVALGYVCSGLSHGDVIDKIRESLPVGTRHRKNLHTNMTPQVLAWAIGTARFLDHCYILYSSVRLNGRDKASALRRLQDESEEVLEVIRMLYDDPSFAQPYLRRTCNMLEEIQRTAGGGR